MFSVQENKKGANWTANKDVQRLPEHSKQVNGAKFSLHRCSLYWKKRKGQIEHQKRLVRDCLNTVNRFLELSEACISVQCLGK